MKKCTICSAEAKHGVQPIIAGTNRQKRTKDIVPRCRKHTNTAEPNRGEAVR